MCNICPYKISKGFCLEQIYFVSLRILNSTEIIKQYIVVCKHVTF